MRVAILYPWFLEYGGAERVVDVIAQMYPDADIYTLILDRRSLSPTLSGRRILASPLNAGAALARIGVRPRPLFATALFPWAVESLQVADYDLVLSSCNPVLMGAHVGADACHVCYCHSPSRSLWDLYDSYKARMPPVFRQLFVASSAHTRMWEFGAAQRVDRFIANSHYVQRRIAQYYRRESTVLYPPIQTENAFCAPGPFDYYLSLGRLAPQKKTELIIEACNRLQRRLVVAGTGRDESRLRRMAGPTIEFVGRVPDRAMPQLLAHCRALLFAADEDCGMAPLEAQSYGRPVIAYGHGGSLETVCANRPDAADNSGVYFAEQTAESLMQAIERFEAVERDFVPERIAARAQAFGEKAFVERMRSLIAESLQQKRAGA